jgi:outer membrane protein assembly factor BamB
MNILRSLLLGACLLTVGSASAGVLSDREFSQDQMLMTNHNVMILSAFDDEDHISAYNTGGQLLWDIRITPKVTSWKLKDGLLFIFAKDRYLEKTYLTCVNPVTGAIIWQTL